ncbi:hypothetical protein Tco_1182735 [Tanacetum coccineum]
MFGHMVLGAQLERQLVAKERKCLVMDSAKNERAINKPSAPEQSHDEVYGCLKGGSGNSRGKRLAISMRLKSVVEVEERRCDRKTKSDFIEEKNVFIARERIVFIIRERMFSVEEKESFPSKRKNFRRKRKNVSG